MRKVFLASVSALVMLFAVGPASASAQAPDVAVCLGAGQSDGSFTPQELNTGQLPGIGLGLAPTACLVLSPDNGAEWLPEFVNGFAEAEPPSEPPSQEDIEAILDAIENLDPANPLAVLLLANTICQRTGTTDYCNALIGGALSGPIPLGNVSLDGESGSCFSGSQSGTGSMFGGGSFYQLEWTADYENPALGAISGTATQFGSEPREVTGVIGPACGAGAKALVLAVQ